jgi:NitT/TauT family transport system substrate-binding protein
MKRQNIISISSFGLIVILALILLFVTKPKIDMVVNDDKDLEKVSVRMKWFYAGTMAGWFAGKEKGFFKNEKINISIRPGGPDNSSVKLVAAGTDQFGVAGADEVLLSREKGIPIVAIAVLFKESPIAFISKKAKGINSPAQWAGKTIEVSYGSNAEVQYRAILKKYGLTNIKEVPYAFNFGPFISDKVDVSVAYIMDQVNTLKNMGIELNIVAAKDEGINPYGDVIITTEKLILSQPDLVHRFLAAAIKSQQWGVDNPEETVKILVSAVPELKFQNEIQVWKSTIPFLLSNEGIEKIGVMNIVRWNKTYEILREFNFIKEAVDINRAYINMN